VLLVFLAACLIVDCGGGGSTTTPSEIFGTNPEVSTTYVLVPGFPGVVPRYVYDLPSSTFDNPPDNLYDWSLTVRHMGPNPYNSNDFDARDNLYKSRIDSANFVVVPIRGAGQHSALERRLNAEPLFKDGRPLVMSFNVRLGEQIQAAENVAQASLYGYVWDGDKNSFGFVFTFFDNRYGMYESYVSNDTYTAFVSSPFSTGPYTTVMNGQYSHNMMISEKNMRNIIGDLNTQCRVDCVKWHSDLSRYKFTAIGILHEVFIADKSQRVVSELQVHGFELAR
jgi:hypothetical protein